MLLYPRNRLIIDGLYSVQYSKRLLPHALFKSPIRQTHARYRFNEKRVFFLKSFEAEKIKEKTKKKRRGSCVLTNCGTDWNYNFQ